MIVSLIIDARYRGRDYRGWIKAWTVMSPVLIFVAFMWQCDCGQRTCRSTMRAWRCTYTCCLEWRDAIIQWLTRVYQPALCLRLTVFEAHRSTSPFTSGSQARRLRRNTYTRRVVCVCSSSSIRCFARSFVFVCMYRSSSHRHP